MLRLISVVFVCLGLLSGLANAKDMQINRLVAAWQKWAIENGVKKSTISYARDGEIVYSEGLGVTASKKMGMASLSKAISAACVANLETAGKLEYSSTLGELLGQVLQELPSSSQTITVSQLLTHTSGLGPDSTQKSMAEWLGGTDRPHYKVSNTALNRVEQSGQSDRYLYNNENYAVLGLIIETVSGEGYGQYCFDNVLAPHGIKSAQLSQPWGAFAAWGGWRMTADDYNRFLIGKFGPQTRLGNNPDLFPIAKVDGAVSYGMGTFLRPFKGSHNYWHFGLLCFQDVKRRGSYFAYFEGKQSVVVTHNICSSWDQMFSLDAAISGAIYSKQ